MTEWWDPATGTILGAVLGATVGVVFGGIGGGVGGLLAAKGKAKGFVLGLFYAGLAFGVAIFAAGLVALATDQPYHVYYPLLLIGGIAALVVGPIIPAMRSRYRAAEQRRLDARLAQ